MKETSNTLTYEQKIRRAAEKWLVMHPESKLSTDSVANIIAKNNYARWLKPCDEFDYSGTVWCDRCGFEKESHSK